MPIDDETTDVLIGGYLSKDAAQEDYEAVLNCGVRLWGAVVVSKDLEGELSVEQSDHMVEEGAAGLASVGFVVGLAAPPLLAATAIGAGLGAVGGKLLHKRSGSKIEKAAGEGCAAERAHQNARAELHRLRAGRRRGQLIAHELGEREHGEDPARPRARQKREPCAADVDPAEPGRPAHGGRRGHRAQAGDDADEESKQKDHHCFRAA